MVHVLLRTDGHGSANLEDLYRWLRGERALSGRVTLVHDLPGEEDLGAGPGAIEVILGSGGIGVALVGPLTAWLQSRRSEVTIEVTVGDKSVKVQAKNVDEVTPLLTEALRIDDDRDS